MDHPRQPTNNPEWEKNKKLYEANAALAPPGTMTDIDDKIR